MTVLHTRSLRFIIAIPLERRVNLYSTKNFRQHFIGAVDRRRQNNADGQTADFINIVAFGRLGEFAEKYLHKGTKVALSGRIQTGSYTNKDGVRVYTTDIIAEDIEFAESKNSAGSDGGYTGTVSRPEPASAGDGFMNIPDGIDEELPFN